jgi:hypothetical protein
MKLLDQLARSARLRKAIYLAGGIIAGVCIFAVPALAADFDPLGMMKELINTLFEFMLYIGIIVVIFGFVTFGISFSSQDSQQRTRGLFEVAGGLLVIGVKIILNTIGVTW